MALSTLTIDMNARLASFERDLGRSVAIAQKNANQLEKSFAGVSTVLKSLGTVIGIRQIVQMGQALVGAAADLDDLAEKTGASVESLSKLQQVARNTGIPISDVEELVIRFNKALAGSDDEAKGAAKALEQLGLQASDLRNLDRAEAVIKFARALDQFTDSGGKADVILAILKRGGEQYAPLLKEIAQAGELQASVTKKQAAEAETFQKQLASLGEAIRGAAQDITLEFLPGIIEFINQVRAATEVSGGFFAALKNSFGLDLSDAERELTKVEDKLRTLTKEKEKFGDIPQAIEQFGAATPESDTNFDARIEGLKERQQFLKDFLATEERLNAPKGTGQRVLPAIPPAGNGKPGKPLKPEKPDTYFEGVFDSSIAAIQEFKDAYDRDVQQLISGTDTAKLDEIATKLAFARTEFERPGSAIKPEVYEELVAQLKEAAREAQPVNEELDRLNQLLGQTDSAKIRETEQDLQLLREAFVGVADSGKFGLITSLEYIEAVEAALGQTTKNAQEVVTNLDLIKDGLQGLAQDASQAFVDLLFEGKNTFADLAKHAIKELARILIYQQLLGPLAAGLGGALGGTGFLAGVNSFKTGAGGGNVSAGQGYLVGEKGPEWFMPRNAGAIIPNNEIRNSGGNSITVVVNSGRDTQQQGRGGNQNLAQFARQMGALMDQKLIEAQRPGGLLSA